jgi:hypothetical protein
MGYWQVRVTGSPLVPVQPGTLTPVKGHSAFFRQQLCWYTSQEKLHQGHTDWHTRSQDTWQMRLLALGDTYLQYNGSSYMHLVQSSAMEHAILHSVSVTFTRLHAPSG